MLTSPGQFIYGKQADYTAPILAIFVCATLALLKHRERPRLLALFFWSFAAACFDWVAAFFAVGVVTADAVLCRGLPRRRVVLATFGGVGLAFVAYLGLLSVWEGGLAPAIQSLRSPSKAILHFEASFGWRFLSNQGRHLIDLYGYLPSILTVCFIVSVIGRIARGRGNRDEAFTLIWPTICVVNVVAFPFHAMSHDFWWYHLLPAVLMAFVATFELLRRRALWLALLFLVLSCAWSGFSTYERHQLDHRGEAQALSGIQNRHFDENDIIIDLHGPSVASYYTHAHVIDTINSRELFVNTVERYLAGEFGAKDLVVFYPQIFEQAHPWFEDLRRQFGGDSVSAGAAVYWKLPAPPSSIPR